MLQAHAKKIASIAVLAFVIILLCINFPSSENSPRIFGAVQSGLFSSFGQTGGYRGLLPHVSDAFPPFDPDTRVDSKKYKEWNTQTLTELHVCVALKNCGPNQRKVALLASHWFEESVVRGWRGGEGVWALSVYKHLRAMGYTTLFASSFEEATEQYRMFPDLVKVVIRQKAGECHNDVNCVKSATNPRGLPAWKIFDFEFFASKGGHFHPSMLKGKWILSANPLRDPDDDEIQYIGYSIQDECTQLPAIPLAQRSDHAWLLMKQIKYVYDNAFAWNRSFFALAAADPALAPLNLSFAGAWQLDQRYGGWKPEEMGMMSDIEDREGGVVNLGKMGPEAFVDVMRRSRVMVGVGNPWWSPSPYHALCQGVPFVNPILTWDRNDPWNKSKWRSQHPTLQRLDPPYVYNVHAGNYTGFVAAIQQAFTTEIPSFIPEHMTERAVRERVRELMEHDWRADAARLLGERRGEEGAYVFEL